MSMTTRREPANARTAPRAATTSPTHHQPDNGHQPLPLDNRSSIWATEESRRSVPAGVVADDHSLRQRASGRRLVDDQYHQSWRHRGRRLALIAAVTPARRDSPVAPNAQAPDDGLARSHAHTSAHPLCYIGTIAIDGKQSRDKVSKRDRCRGKAFVRALDARATASPESEHASRRLQGRHGRVQDGPAAYAESLGRTGTTDPPGTSAA